MILLWGLEQDRPLCSVFAQLHRTHPVCLLNQAEILDCHIDITFTPTLAGTIETPDGVFPIEDFSAAYLRPYNLRSLPALARLPADSQEWFHAMSFEDILWSWAESTPALVLTKQAMGDAVQQFEAVSVRTYPQLRAPRAGDVNYDGSGRCLCIFEGIRRSDL
jgi:hypothetical protein